MLTYPKRIFKLHLCHCYRSVEQVESFSKFVLGGEQQQPQRRALLLYPSQSRKWSTSTDLSLLKSSWWKIALGSLRELSVTTCGCGGTERKKSSRAHTGTCLHSAPQPQTCCSSGKQLILKWGSEEMSNDVRLLLAMCVSGWQIKIKFKKPQKDKKADVKFSGMLWLAMGAQLKCKGNQHNTKR